MLAGLSSPLLSARPLCAEHAKPASDRRAVGNSPAMGIRYWGSPLPAHLVATARINPRLLHIDDDYDDYLWDLREDESDGPAHWGSGKHALDLDKAFNDFQVLWRTEPPKHRPAIELVRGDVTHTSRGGWKPYYGIIDPDRVEAVRRDISLTRDDHIEDFIAAGLGRYRDDPELYVQDLIVRRDSMLTFLDARLVRGEGVLYTIG